MLYESPLVHQLFVMINEIIPDHIQIVQIDMVQEDHYG